MRNILVALALLAGLGLGGAAAAQPVAPAQPTPPAAPTASGQTTPPPEEPAVAPAQPLTQEPSKDINPEPGTIANPSAPATPAASAPPGSTAAQPGQPGATATQPSTLPQAGAAGTRPKKQMPPVPPRTDLAHETFWMPPSSSTQAPDVDWLFYGITALSIFCFVAITIVTVYFAWRYRARPGHEVERSSSHNDFMEITWTIIPSIICVIIFIYGWRGFLDLNTPPEHGLEVQVTAEKWNWTFKYPNGYQDPNLHVPVGRPVRLTMRSKDVLHSLWVPAFRIKQDVIPNRYTKLWFEATTPGVYRLYCTEYCGTGHSQMKHLVQVHPPGGFEQWLEEAEAAMLDMPPAQLGEYLYKNRGCAQCHSVDGSNKTGPTWKGLFGSSRALAGGGSAVADETYLRESILEPKDKVVAGFNPVMPTFKGQLKDEQIDGLIEYIKTLKP